MQKLKDLKHGRAVEIIGLCCCIIPLHNGSLILPVEFDPLLWYKGAMNYTSPDKPVPESIAASLARSEAQIAAGQTVPLEPVLDRLRASIDRMQKAEAEKPTTPTPKG
jgi:hypothetical protein